MTERRSIDYQIGFADSEIISFQSDKNSLLIFLKSWDEKILKFEFSNSIFFMIYNNWYISDICEMNNPKNMEKALLMVYADPPKLHPYKAFQFIDIDGDIAAEVYCTDLIISIEDQKKKFG